MPICEQWWLHCTSQWGQWMPLSEHVYCVAVTFKMTERVEQHICIKFFIKLEHSSVETVHMSQKATGMGSWWWAASSQQCAHSCFTSRAEFFLAKHQITQVTQTPYNPNLAPCNFWLFPKLKSPLKGKRFQAVDETRKIQRDSWWRLENCVRSQGAYFEGDWGDIVLCTMFLISCIFFNKCFYFM